MTAIEVFLRTPPVVGFSWSHRMGFSQSHGTNPGFFCPLLGPCGMFSKPRHQSGFFLPTPRPCWVFPRARWPPCGIFTKPWRQPGFFVHSLSSCFFFPRAYPCGIFTDGACILAQRRDLHPSPVGGKLHSADCVLVPVRRWVCAVPGPAWPLPRQGLYASST